MATVAWCPGCGSEPRCDEDGCCVMCGSDCGLIHLSVESPERHKDSGRAEERAAIVADLRALAKRLRYDNKGHGYAATAVLESAADRYERGEHVKKGGA